MMLLQWIAFAWMNEALAFVSPAVTLKYRTSHAIMSTGGILDEETKNISSESVVAGDRRGFFGALGLGILATITPIPAIADVSDGNTLPQGALQFAKAIKLQKDVKDVRRRLSTAQPDDIESKEWSNIEKFLRDIYSVAENDMKAVAVGIFNAENKAIALKDIDQIKKYARAGDVSAGKKDAKSLEQILAKVSDLQVEFFDSLSDVPDEL